MDAFDEFFLTPAPDPFPGEEDIWFDIMSTASYIAGIGQRIRETKKSFVSDSIEIDSIKHRYLSGNQWICYMDKSKVTSLRDNTELHQYAQLLQRACNQLQSEI